ncbi:MAG: methionyl-tRNA formyltransferase [Verrucomicrobiales bacterium]|jgi:methionyl-tRNA formyltransferase|nr:methionyl-tRNA formyltransferase [Verrucomicrobiales bacterium]
MRIVYIGSGEIGVPALNALLESDVYKVVGVITQPDRPAGRQLKLTPSPIKQAALAKHQSVYQPENINSPAALEQIQYLKPDLAVVCAYGQILRQKLLDLPPLGCLNIHASLLPQYRGSSCIQAAIRNGDSKTGITVMWMNAGLDTGDILLQQELRIANDDTAGVVHDKLSLLAPGALMDALKLIAKGKAPRLPQDKEQASYAGKLKKEDGHINWDQEQQAIDRHIRAMSPWPSAYAWLATDEGKKMLKIYDTIISNRARGEPGTVLRIDDHGVLVAAAKGGLLLREVQLESRKRMHAAEFARGCHLKVGAKLE